jgi:hypothetical protein
VVVDGDRHCRRVAPDVAWESGPVAEGQRAASMHTWRALARTAGPQGGAAFKVLCGNPSPAGTTIAAIA